MFAFALNDPIFCDATLVFEMAGVPTGDTGTKTMAEDRGGDDDDDDEKWIRIGEATKHRLATPLPKQWKKPINSVVLASQSVVWKEKICKSLCLSKTIVVPVVYVL